MKSSRLPTEPLGPGPAPSGGDELTADLRAAPARPRPPGLVLERYQLIERLGAGAFGEVWRARDEHLHREVAVKIVPRERVQGGRFEREARAAARLSHPGIVRLYEAARDEREAYLVCELVRGPTLAQLIAEELLSEADVARFGLALSDALGHAHSCGVVHRDLKPANILIPERPASPAEAAKLTDFGVAHLFGGEALTRTGDVIGTAAYMAPEQAAGLATGPSADVFSLAVVLYEAFSGINPLAGQRRGVRRAVPRLPPLRRVRRDLPRELTEAIDRALHHRPELRSSLADLRAALAEATSQVSERLPASASARPRVSAAHPERLEDTWEPSPERWRQPGPRVTGAPWGAEGGEEPGGAGASTLRLTRRRLPAAAAAALLAASAASALPAPALPPGVLPLAGGVAVLLLPRVGWLAMAGAVVALAAAGGLPGEAMLLLVAFLAPVLLLPFRPRAWSFPVLAPLLGLIALGGAWPALAGRARGPFTRAGLGACGWFWLLLASAWRGGSGLYLPQAAGLLARQQFAPSVGLALSGVLRPLVISGALLGALAWAGGAAVLPWLVRGRSLPVDACLALLWTVALLAATAAAVGSTGHFGAFGSSSPALLGAVAGGLLALLPSLRRAWRGGSDRELP